MSRRKLTVQKFFDDKRDQLILTLLAGDKGLDNEITRRIMQRPSLLLAGYLENFAEKRIQVLGKTEMDYLSNLSEDALRESADNLFRWKIPAIIISKGIAPHPYLVECAEKAGIPLFVSNIPTEEVFSHAGSYLDSFFAPRIGLHGTMVDVYGVGILYTGSPGIGKSECALSLVEKGHRLIADDIVNIKRKSGNVLIASGELKSGFFLEIRGIGIIDIEKLYGIRAVRIQKRLEMQVHLELWDNLRDYERLGLDETYTTILGVQIPRITIPVSPGKNIAAISEVISMNHMLKVYGHHPAKDFVARMNEVIRRRELTDQYLESDYE